MSSKAAQRYFLLLVIFSGFLFIFSFATRLYAQEWKPDVEVTEVGRNAVRARDILDFTLGTPAGDLSPVKQAWVVARNIAITILLVALIIFGFGVMLKRTETYRVMPYLPVVVLLIIFIFFSYPITSLIIQLIDILQIYLIGTVRAKNLLTVGFDYNFIGYRIHDYRFNESAQISLFLTRATSFTYMAMVAILFIRHIILWFLVIFSPFLSIALALPFTRNAGKIWIGEFFRWVLYGPVFAVFLRAVVIIWESGIPLAFKTLGERHLTAPGPYPTAVSILLGGPGEEVKISNSLNYVDTYAKYVIALLMLWAAIILPFLLLRIFRDFLATFFKSRESDFRAWFSKVSPYGEKAKPAPTAEIPPPVSVPLPPPPVAYGATFEALERPAVVKATAEFAKGVAAAQTSQILQQLGFATARESVFEAERRGIANLATAEMDRSWRDRVSQSLNKMRYPAVISDATERARFTSVVRELAVRAAGGDEQARSVLNAAGMDYQELLAEQGIKIAAVVGRPLGMEIGEKGVAGPSKERIVEKLTHLRTEIGELFSLAERGDEGSMKVLDTLSTSIGPDFERVVSERIGEEGRETKYRVIREEIENLIERAETGDLVAIKSLATVSQALDLNFVDEGNVRISNEVSKIASLAESGDEKSVEIIKTLAASFGFEVEREIQRIEAREGFGTSVKKVQSELSRVIHQAEGGDPEAQDILQSVVVSLGPEFLSKLKKRKVKKPVEISLEDYEQVKKMWLNNYRHAELPEDLEIKERKGWLKYDIQKITNALEKITSSDPMVKEEGLKIISGILTFVLLGDFSETEIIAYLKAKLEAAKQVLEEIRAGKKVEEMEEELVEVPLKAMAEEGKRGLRAEMVEEEEEKEEEKKKRRKEEEEPREEK